MASELDLSKVKDLDYKTKLVINGYFRTYNDISYGLKIPDDIKLICLLFYDHYMNEYFIKSKDIENIILSKDRLSIKKTENNINLQGNRICCGVQRISSNSIYNKYIWKIKYLNVKYNVFVGLMDLPKSNDKINSCFWMTYKLGKYGYHSKDVNINIKKYDRYNARAKRNDIITNLKLLIFQDSSIILKGIF